VEKKTKIKADKLEKKHQTKLKRGDEAISGRDRETQRKLFRFEKDGMVSHGGWGKRGNEGEQ